MPHNLCGRFVNDPLLRIIFGFRVSIWDSGRHPLHHLLHPQNAGTVKGSTGDAVIGNEFRMEAAVLLCVLGQDRFLIADGIALTVQTIILGRFTFRTLLDFEGMGCILTTIARRYLHRDGTEPYENFEYAQNARKAWFSVPEKTKNPWKSGQKAK